ncbi:MAG: hypothetical protein BA066_06685 [Candidatus Korarchaeota archaeon NZ13-K]|nr:MAG: hypothetical protein BA066_06685 [Candidatus Korarchaeota archaeon NZ13-K]
MARLFCTEYWDEWFKEIRVKRCEKSSRICLAEQLGREVDRAIEAGDAARLRELEKKLREALQTLESRINVLAEFSEDEVDVDWRGLLKKMLGKFQVLCGYESKYYVAALVKMAANLYAIIAWHEGDVLATKMILFTIKDVDWDDVERGGGSLNDLARRYFCNWLHTSALLEKIDEEVRELAREGIYADPLTP